MRKLIALAMLLLAAAAPVAAQEYERLFYYTDSETSWNSLVGNIDRIDVIAPSAYFVEQDGIVWGSVDPRVLALAKERNVAVVPLLVNRGFVQQELHDLLTSDAARARVVSSLAGLCRQNGYRGMQIDFENLSVEDRDAFTRFYREAADALHSAGCQISVAVVHRPAEFSGANAYQKWLMDSWRGGYDLRALADAGDFISVMTYSQHTRRTPPGPQAGLPWMEDVVEYFLQFMPPSKLSLGIATGSQHWYTSYDERIQPELARSYSSQLSHAWALGMIERHGGEIVWNDEHAVSYSFFPVGGTFEWIFLEDARSFQARTALMQKHRLRGFSVWVLGPEDPRIWEGLRARR